MTPTQMLEVIGRGLPGARLVEWYEQAMACRVMWTGHTLDISVCGIDGYPVFLVTTPGFQMNDVTAKALECLDSVVPEVVERRAPWPDIDAMIARLRELSEGDDDDGA